jgi:hemerythrin superfamily protein
MDIAVSDIQSLALSAQEPATLEELLAAGKKLPPDATSLLMLDHAEAKAMFRQYGMERNAATKRALAGKICTALTVHAQIEEEIFYPKAGAALEDDEMVAEAVEEHAEMKAEIANVVEGMAAGKTVDRPVKKLMQLVEHHVQEEETAMFPDMRQTDVDLYELGGRLAARRVETLLALRREAAKTEGRL